MVSMERLSRTSSLPLSRVRFGSAAQALQSPKTEESSAADVWEPSRTADLPKAPPVPPEEIKKGTDDWRAARRARRQKRLWNTVAAFTFPLMLLGTPPGKTGLQMAQDGLDKIHAMESTLIYDTDTANPKSPSDLEDKKLAKKIQVVTFETPDGVKLSGWYVPPADTSKPTVLFAHGRAGNMTGSGSLPFLETFADSGYGFFMFDYRGYGDSEGKPGEEGLYTDMRAASDWLANEKNTRVEDQVLMGYSLGGGVTTEVAQDKPYKAVVLISTFTSITDVELDQNERNHEEYGIPDEVSEFIAKPVIGPAVLRMLNTQEFNSIDKIGNVESPLLIVHGAADDYIPTWMSRTNFEAATGTSQKELLMVPEKDHSGIVDAAPAMADKLDAMLDV